MLAMTQKMACIAKVSLYRSNATVSVFPLQHKQHRQRRSPSAQASQSERQSVQQTQELKRSQLASLSSLVTDANVPEGHEGLHGFLYNKEGEEEHGASTYNFRKGEDEGEVLIGVSKYISSRESEKPLGVYAVYDIDKDVQYIGYSRNMVLSVADHREKLGEDKCAFVRVMVFMNKSMATRENLERECENWLNHEGVIPPGNGIDRELWESKEKSEKTMTPSQLAEYEEKKLKLRKAMGANLADEVPGETLDSRQRRLAMIQAVEGDDWSAVINSQTELTLNGVDDKEYLKEHPDQIVSPFSRARVHRNIGNSKITTSVPSMTVENIDRALEEVRPYLIADGGNVEVVSVESGIVFLRLQGACGTCPSSTATMKMGIERALKATFGEALKDVVQLDKNDISASIASVNEHLNMLRPAIKGYGGEIEVLRVDSGRCEVRYKGPKPIGMGIQAAIKDKFPDIKEVVLLDCE